MNPRRTRARCSRRAAAGLPKTPRITQPLTACQRVVRASPLPLGEYPANGAHNGAAQDLSLPTPGPAPQDLQALTRISKTLHCVVVDHAHGLHEGIADGRADEIKTSLLQILPHRVRIP